MTDIDTTLKACELIWRQQSMSEAAIDEMRTELASHLSEAASAGKDVQTVIGPNLERFARSWLNDSPARMAPSSSSTSLIQKDRVDRASRTRTRLMIALAAIAAITLAGAIFGGEGDATELETWQWIFAAGAVALLIGEMLSGGFFVLPFAIGSAAAAILAFARVEVTTLLIVFIAVSILALWGLREFASKDDDVVVPVGANRYVGQSAVVTDSINGIGTVGRVRIETESWMAISDSNRHISEGSLVVVTEVRGARLVVSAPG